MKNGNVIIGKYDIKPNTKDIILEINDFNIRQVDKEYKKYDFKEKQYCNGLYFYCSIDIFNGIIKNINLRNGDEKYNFKGYSGMTQELVYGLVESHNKFLEKYLGVPHKIHLPGQIYDFHWGYISSFHYIQDGSSGIKISYKAK